MLLNANANFVTSLISVSVCAVFLCVFACLCHMLVLSQNAILCQNG